MAIYQYRCRNCFALKEHVCLMKDMPESVECDLCHAESFPIISAPNFHLGEGAWARNNYSGDSNLIWSGVEKEKN